MPDKDMPERMTSFNEYVMLSILEKARADSVINEQRRKIRELTMLSMLLKDRLRESDPESAAFLERIE